jgi:hypothetical protein
VLDARIDVLRLRIQYEFFLTWFVIEREFPFLTVPPPAFVLGEAAYLAGDVGRRIAQLVWRWPGLQHDSLLDLLGGPSAASGTSLEVLKDRFIVSDKEGYLYVTGRNPYLLNQRLSAQPGVRRSGATVHWSRLF